MAGLKGRSGRKRIWNRHPFDQVADLTFEQAYRLLIDESVPLTDRVRICLPLALKRVPDQLNVISANLNLSDDAALKMIELAKANLDIQHKLQELNLSLESSRLNDLDLAKGKIALDQEPSSNRDCIEITGELIIPKDNDDNKLS